jgi:hypothetical protein
MSITKLYLLITDIDTHGIGGVESHFVSMVEYFRHKTEYSLFPVGLHRRAYEFYSDILKNWNVELHNLGDVSRLRQKKARLAEFIEDNSIIFLNSPQWFPILEWIKRSKPKCRIVLRSGGNDLWMSWRMRESWYERHKRRLYCRMQSMSFPKYVARGKVRALNRYADRLITNSCYSTNKARELGISRERISQITGGAHPDKVPRKACRKRGTGYYQCRTHGGI